jgi:hypothetical protein
LARQLVGKPHFPNLDIKWTQTALYVLLCVSIIITAFFLGDALRRLREIIKRNNSFELALNTMRLHIFVMYFHTITFTVCELSFCASLFYPSSPALIPVWNGSRILAFLSQGIS